MPVYVIRANSTDLYKVGIAADPLRRLAELQTASPLHLHLVCQIEGDRSAERRVHRALHQQHARGEWFQLANPPTEADLTGWATTETSVGDLEPLPDPSSIDPVGTVEIAERLGVSRSAVDAWRSRDLRDPFPASRWTVGGRPAWEWADVERWARSTGRLTTPPAQGPSPGEGPG